MRVETICIRKKVIKAELYASAFDKVLPESKQCLSFQFGLFDPENLVQYIHYERSVIKMGPGLRKCALSSVMGKERSSLKIRNWTK